jgi:hypothetical protein
LARIAPSIATPGPDGKFDSRLLGLAKRFNNPNSPADWALGVAKILHDGWGAKKKTKSGQPPVVVYTQQIHARLNRLAKDRAGSSNLSELLPTFSEEAGRANR